ncbi:MAG: hypothetical protein QNK22_00195 [Xanthomonadales bacterium]|nr:hypothetical protein [Xanthomonadales bacterium]
MRREPVEKPAWAAGNPSRSQPGLRGTRREGGLGRYAQSKSSTACTDTVGNKVPTLRGLK